MEYKIGQRWMHTDQHTPVQFIAEIISIKSNCGYSSYNMKVLQKIKGHSSDYWSELKSNNDWIWEYLQGQDRI